MVGKYSRYLFCESVVDDQNRVFLGDRKRFTYRERSDNRYHVVAEGDTLFVLASTYFNAVELQGEPWWSPAMLYWVIADFQPTPIFDVTLPLEIGRTIVIPSVRVFLEEIMDTNRTEEFRGA